MGKTMYGVAMAMMGQGPAELCLAEPDIHDI